MFPVIPAKLWIPPVPEILLWEAICESGKRIEEYSLQEMIELDGNKYSDYSGNIQL